MLHLLKVLVIVFIAIADALPQTKLLNDGTKIPLVALGTFGNLKDLDRIKPAVIHAIESGYRHFDTANLYQNDKQLGEAIIDVISRGIVTREELFITTKLTLNINSRERVIPDLQSCLKRLQLDYVDLFLIHAPGNLYNNTEHDYLSVWKGMEDAKNSNLTRSIGVSNFNSNQINKLLANSQTVPSVNQIEVNPTYTSLDLVAYCQSLNITVLSYAPFGFIVQRVLATNSMLAPFEVPILKQLAQKYGKMPSQIVLRYLIDRGTIPVVGSTNMEHIDTNIDVFDFYLTPEEIYSINELNQDTKVYNLNLEFMLKALTYYGLN